MSTIHGLKPQDMARCTTSVGILHSSLYSRLILGLKYTMVFFFNFGILHDFYFIFGILGGLFRVHLYSTPLPLHLSGPP